MEFENRTFETEYRDSYVRKNLPRLTKFKSKQEYKDPITESFKHYLTTGEGNEENNIENCTEFLKRYGEQHPKMVERYFKELINTEAVDKTEEYEKKTTYHQQFCSFDGYEKYLQSKENPRVSLPEGWVEGTTTQKWSYRDPAILFPKIYKTRASVVKPVCEMDDAHKHSLKTKNVSELSGTIGELGTFILENEMHGPIQKFEL